MTTPKAEEVAEKLVSSSKWCPSGSYNYNILREMIAEALTAYADERVKEAIKYAKDHMNSPENNALVQTALGKARAEALEKAAKIADGIAENYFQVYRKAGYKGPGNEGSQAASAAATNIRALKEKP